MTSDDARGRTERVPLLVDDNRSELLGSNLSPTHWRPFVPRSTKQLGMFVGVFVPCSFNIMGVILFERLLWAVGMQGLVYLATMGLIGGTAVMCTVLSLCAIATNGQVEAGGTYYLVSRSIGPELGGAVGLMFYCANVVAVSFYTHGFSEACQYAFFPSAPPDKAYLYQILIGFGVVASMLLTSLIGAGVFSKSLLYIFHLRNIAICFGFIFLLHPGRESWTFDLAGRTVRAVSTHLSWHTFMGNLWPYDPADYYRSLTTATPTPIIVNEVVDVNASLSDAGAVSVATAAVVGGSGVELMSGGGSGAVGGPHVVPSAPSAVRTLATAPTSRAYDGYASSQRLGGVAAITPTPPVPAGGKRSSGEHTTTPAPPRRANGGATGRAGASTPMPHATPATHATPRTPTPLSGVKPTPLPTPSGVPTPTVVPKKAPAKPAEALPKAVSYAVVFGVIFPALTGIMAGTNMSGVLHRPDLAIPRGEVLALVTALMTYFVYVVTASFTLPQLTTASDVYALFNVGWGQWGRWVIIVGTFGSTLSSAGASLQSAGRLLQAITLDGLLPIPRFLGGTWGGEPVTALVVSAALGAIIVLVPDLNTIAPILTMFFLITYATTNFAALLHSAAGHPNFRPRFRYFSPWVGAVGLVLNVMLMFMLQWAAACMALVVLVLAMVVISVRGGGSDWGVVTDSLIFHQVRKYLLRLNRGVSHVKFWRAHLLYLTHDPTSRVNVLDTLNALKKGGLLMVGEVIIPPANIISVYNSVPNAAAIETGDDGAAAGGAVGAEGGATEVAPAPGVVVAPPNRAPARGGAGARRVGVVPGVGSVLMRLAQQRSDAWHTVIEAAGLKAFSKTTVSNCFYSGAAHLFALAGVGPLRPNTVVVHALHDSTAATSSDFSSPRAPHESPWVRDGASNSVWQRVSVKPRHLLKPVVRDVGIADGWRRDQANANARAAAQLRGELPRGRESAVADTAGGAGMASASSGSVVPGSEDDWSGDVSALDYASAVSDLVDAGANVLMASRFRMLSLEALFSKGKRPAWADSSAPTPRRAEHCDPQFPRIDVWIPPWEAVFSDERAPAQHAIDAVDVSASVEKHASSADGLHTGPPEPAVAVEQRSVDVALQLAQMLNSAEGWDRHAYVRMCTVVSTTGPSYRLARRRVARLHQRFVREGRIRCSIHVFILVQDAPDLAAKLVEVQNGDAVGSAAAAVADGGASINGDAVGGGAAGAGSGEPGTSMPMNGRHFDAGVEQPMTSVMSSQGSSVEHKRRTGTVGHAVNLSAESQDFDSLFDRAPIDLQREVLASLISRNSAGAAVTFVPVDPPPKVPMTAAEAQQWVKEGQVLLEAAGPTFGVIGAQQEVMCRAL